MQISRVPGHSVRTAVCRFAAALLIIPLAAHGQTTDTWSLGGSGLWSTAGNWSANVVPNNGTPTGSTYNVDIVDGVSTVTLNISVGIDDLTLAKGNTLAIDDGVTFTLSGPTVSNNGAIQLNGGGGNNGFINLNGNTTLTGGGTLTLSTTTSGGGSAYIQQATGGLTLTNSGNTIQGNGIIGNGGLAVVNATGGTIDANVSGGVLTVNNSGGVTNTGLLEATNGGTLAFNGVGLTNTGGNLTASGAGSVVSLANTTVTGGALNTSGGGVIESAATTTLNGVTVSTGSTYTASNGATTDVVGTITNNGAIRVNGGAGNNGLINLSGNTTLTGGGTVTLSTTTSGGGSAYIQQASGGLTLTNNNNVIQGNGIIGNGGLAFVNSTSGIVDANVSGASLTLNGSGGVTNGGLLEASSGGILAFNSVALANAGGNLTSTGAGSVINLANTTVTGGTLNTASGGVIESAATTVLDGSTSAGAVTLNGVFTGSNGATTVLLGTTTSNGAINQAGGSGNNGVLAFGSSTATASTLQGGGTLNLTTTAAGGGQAYIEQAVGGVTLTNVNNTIQGEGIIGNGALTLVNETKGTIDANSTAGTLTATLLLNGSGGITNTGLLEATNNGDLQISTTVADAGGTIEAKGANALVNLVGGTISGGTLATTGGAAFDSTSSTLTGVTLSAGSALTVANNETTLVNGTITNDGAIKVIGGAGANGVLAINSNTTLTGGGTLTLATTTSGGGNAYLLQNNGGLILTNTNNTIQGNGIIGNGGIAVVNSTAGIIDSNVSGGVLTLNGSGGITNTGLLEATNGGQLAFNTSVTNTKGNITASGAGSVVTLSGTTITGGTLNTSGGATMESTGTNTLNGVTVSAGSTYTASDGTTNFLVGTITNDGAILLKGGAGNNGFLDLNSNVTLSGGGAVTLSTTTSGGGSAYILQNVGGLTLTNANNTIQGNGIIGNGGLTVVNASGGTISSNAPGGTLQINGSGGLTNAGALSVSSGDLLQVSNGPFTNFSGTTLTGGTYNVSGTLQITELGNTGGEIVTDAANIILNGTGSTFIDSAGANALSKLATIAAKSSFTLLGGANFTTAGNFSNKGTLSVGAGSTFDVVGSLSNFSNATHTLKAGTYNVTGTLEFPNANIVTNAAKITLTGSTAQILNSINSANGLANLASNAAKGTFALAGGANCTTAGNFSTAGTLTIGPGSTFKVGGPGVFAQTAGTTTDRGTLVASGGLNLSGGSLFGSGTVTGNLDSSGIVTPGISATKTGILTNVGTYTQNAGGNLDIDIAGTTVGTKFDVLNATTAVLGGTLNITSKFTPTVGSTFKILNFNSETGTFATVNGLTINGTEAYTVTYQPTDVLLTVVSTAAPAARTADMLIAGAASADDRVRMVAALRDFNAGFSTGGRDTLAMQNPRLTTRQHIPQHIGALAMIRIHR